MTKTIAGKIIAGFLKFIKNLFKGLVAEAKVLIPIAITIVNAIKFAVENPVTGNIIDFILDAVKKAIPGEADDILIDKIKAMLIKWLPKILDRLNSSKDIANIEDDNARYIAILNEFKFEDEKLKTFLYNDLACLFTSELSDGKIPVKDAIVAVPVTYKFPEVMNS